MVFPTAMLLGLAVLPNPAIAGAGSGGGERAIYDSLVSPLPGNLPSVGAEAYAFNELGNQ